MSEPNPYAAPVAPGGHQEEVKYTLTPKDRAKADAVCKDAGQFWLAIIMCIACSAIASFIIPIWFSIRLLQWTSLSNKYPELRQPGFRAGTFGARFQSAQWKLIVGLVVGAVVFVIVVLSIFSLYVAAPPSPQLGQ